MHIHRSVLAYAILVVAVSAQIVDQSTFLNNRQAALTRAFNNKDAKGVISFFTEDSLLSEYSLGPPGMNLNHNQTEQLFTTAFALPVPLPQITTLNVTGNKIFSVWEFKEVALTTVFYASIQNWRLKPRGNPDNILDWQIHVARSYATPAQGLLLNQV